MAKVWFISPHNFIHIYQPPESGTDQRRTVGNGAAKEAALDLIRDRVIIETQAEHLRACLKAGTVSTNVHLRKLHNFCLAMNWLPWPIIPKRLSLGTYAEWRVL
jgi:hypothetical protein